MDYAFILGIDVAAKKLDLCIYDASSRKSSFSKVEYNEEDLEKFLKDNPRINCSNCLVGLESTGDYHLKVSKFFLGKGFKVKLINPILTKQYTRATIRGKKTDKTDSEIICKLILDNNGNSLELAKITDERKELMRLSSSLTGIASQLKLRLQSVERKSLDNTDKIKEEIDNIIDSIKTLSNNIVKQATEARTKDEEFIDSIPGFAEKLSAIVYHEIGDIKRFPNSDSLVAYAGLDPKIIQSGEKLSTTGRLTKRGSSHLRAALFLAANVARLYDEDLSNYYDKKKKESRTNTEILCMISRKLLARVYTVLKEQRPYVKKPIPKKTT